jgi:hypothetical protein
MLTMGHALQVLTITAHGPLQERDALVKFARFSLGNESEFGVSGSTYTSTVGSSEP